MTIREDEAPGLWCPFTRGAWAKPTDTGDWRMTADNVGFNRTFVRPGTDEHPLGRCIGHACMAWRTTGSVETGSSAKMDGLSGMRRVSHVVRVGYCGLAGAPGLTDDDLVAVPQPPTLATEE